MTLAQTQSTPRRPTRRRHTLVLHYLAVIAIFGGTATLPLVAWLSGWISGSWWKAVALALLTTVVGIVIAARYIVAAWPPGGLDGDEEEPARCR